MGTYNYYPNDYMLGVPHVQFDVSPWVDFGNGGGDKTDYDIRDKGVIPAGNHGWDRSKRSRSINMFNRLNNKYKYKK